MKEPIYFNYILIWGDFDYEDDIVRFYKIYGYQDYPSMEDAEKVGELLIERGEAGSYYIITNETKVLL